jgi:putative transcriptional regulator
MSLAPALLLAMPQLIDPNFARTVVLLCEHAAEGAFGLIVNRPAEITAAEAVRLEPRLSQPNDLPLLLGGPVEPERGWILSASAPDGVESRELGAGLYLSASPVLLRQVLTARPLPRRTQVLAGYSGWGPGQLDGELAADGWYLCEADVDDLWTAHPNDLWRAVLRRQPGPLRLVAGFPDDPSQN